MIDRDKYKLPISEVKVTNIPFYILYIERKITQYINNFMPVTFNYEEIANSLKEEKY